MTPLRQSQMYLDAISNTKKLNNSSESLTIPKLFMVPYEYEFFPPPPLHQYESDSDSEDGDKLYSGITKEGLEFLSKLTLSFPLSPENKNTRDSRRRFKTCNIEPIKIIHSVYPVSPQGLYGILPKEKNFDVTRHGSLSSPSQNSLTKKAANSFLDFFRNKPKSKSKNVNLKPKSKSSFDLRCFKLCFN